MLDPSGADELIRDDANLIRRSFDDDHFKAVVFIQMHMCGTDYGIMVGVLESRQRVGNFPNFVIIYDGDGSDNIFRFGFPLRFH